VHDNGRKCAQGAGEAGAEQAGSLQIHSAESTQLWKLWKALAGGVAFGELMPQKKDRARRLQEPVSRPSVLSSYPSAAM
jgi:hypothetical protein